MVKRQIPRITWCRLSLIKPGSNLGEKLLEAWLNKSITMEKLNTTIEIRPEISELRMVIAVSPLSTTRTGKCSIKYRETPLFSRQSMKNAKLKPRNASSVGQKAILLSRTLKKEIKRFSSCFIQQGIQRLKLMNLVVAGSI